jgi:hypothetical protein
MCGLDPAGSGQGPVAASCEYGDEPSGSGATELVLAIPPLPPSASMACNGTALPFYLNRIQELTGVLFTRQRLNHISTPNITLANNTNLVARFRFYKNLVVLFTVIL